ENLILLCSTHHTLVHEGGFRIEKDYRDRWFFRRPDGRAVPECGYRPEDVTDDGTGAVEEYFDAVGRGFDSGASTEVTGHASAEAPSDASAGVLRNASAEVLTKASAEARSDASAEASAHSRAIAATA
ncbi:MAG TPA: hypothetical protein VF339_01670, partial [Gammaproteobacteria bacterium]